MDPKDTTPQNTPEKVVDDTHIDTSDSTVTANPETTSSISTDVVDTTSQTTTDQDTFVIPTKLSDPVVAPEPVTPEIDPTLLAHTLEDKWDDDTVPSQQLFQQKVEQAAEAATPVKPEIQVIEKIVYKKQRVHGFFRTLTLIALLLVGTLMLLEELQIFSLNMDWLNMNMFYPIFIILSVIVIWSYKGIFGKIFGLLMFLSVVGGSFILGVYSSLNPTVSNATGNNLAYTLHKKAPYSKIYLSTLVNSLTVDVNQSTGLLAAQYDIQRPLLIHNGTGLSGHDYVIIQESDKVNLLQGVYTRMQVGLTPVQPLYLYVKTFLGQNNLDLSQLDVRGLRIHGGILSLDVTLGDNSISLSPLTGSVQTGLNLSGVTLSGTKIISTGAKAASGAKNQSGAKTTLNTGSNLTGIVLSGNTNIHLDLQAAVGDITLHLPKDMGVRMKYKSYLGKTDLPNFVKNNDVYESSNIKTAKKILNIDALFGLSRLTIVQDR